MAIKFIKPINKLASVFSDFHFKNELANLWEAKGKVRYFFRFMFMIN